MTYINSDGKITKISKSIKISYDIKEDENSKKYIYIIQPNKCCDWIKIDSSISLIIQDLFDNISYRINPENQKFIQSALIGDHLYIRQYSMVEKQKNFDNKEDEKKWMKDKLIYHKLKKQCINCESKKLPKIENIKEITLKEIEIYNSQQNEKIKLEDLEKPLFEFNNGFISDEGYNFYDLLSFMILNPPEILPITLWFM